MATETDGSETDLLLTLDRSFHPPEDCGDERCRDFFLEFIYIVVIPASLLLFGLYVFLFSLLICCCIKRKRKLAAESEQQLATYESVRRATTTIRRMSHGNSTPMLNIRSDSVSLVHNDHRRRGFRPRDSCHSAPGTLQRHHRNRDSANVQDIPPPPPPPPPYRVPAADYLLVDDDDAFLGPDSQLSDFAAEGDMSPESGRENPQRHHHNRQRPHSASNGYTTR